MNSFGNLVALLDYVLDSPRKRHLTGGILLSVSMLFGGLALTVITSKSNDEEDSEDENE